MVYRPLIDRRTGTRKDHDQSVHTICRECSVHCGLTAYLNNHLIVDIQGDRTHPASKGRLCARGIAFLQGIQSRDRLLAPLARSKLSQPFEPVNDWDKALDLCAERLQRTRDRYGPRSIVIGCSQEAGLDFAVGAIRFGRLLGTPYVFQPYPSLNSNHAAFSQACSNHPGHDWPGKTRMLLVEADMATTHPVLFGRVMQAKQAGARIAVADARFTRTMSKADFTLRILPQSGNLLGAAMMKRMLEDTAHLDEIGALKNPFEWKAAFGSLAWDDVFAGLGVSSEEFDALCMFFQSGRPGLVITGQTLAAAPDSGIWQILVPALGPGHDWYPLDPPLPPLFPERDLPRADPGKSTAPPTTPNKRLENLLELDTASGPSFKAAISGGDCFSHVFAPLRPLAESADFIAAFASFLKTTRTAAHLLLPAVLWAEKNELCFSSDRMIQWAQRIREPDPRQKTALDFWTGLGRRFGWQDAFPWTDADGAADPETFYRWILDGSPATRACTLEALMNQPSAPFIWSVKGEPTDTGAAPADYVPKGVDVLMQDSTRESYPLYFQKAPAVSHSSISGQSWPWTREFEDENDIQINPQTARVLGIENGETIVVRSAQITMEGRAWISRMVPAWMVASPKASDSDWVLVHKLNQSGEESRALLKGFLP